MPAVAGLLTSLANAQNALEDLRLTTAVATGDLHVEVTAETITVAAHGVTLREVLEEIARQSGLSIESRGSLDERITLDVHEQLTPTAMRRILRGQSYTLQYVARGPGEFYPGRLWIYSSGAEQDGDAFSVNVPRPAHGGGVVGALATLGAGELDGALSSALSDDEAGVRLGAVSALGVGTGDGAATTLAMMALSDEDPAVRDEAVYALGEMADEINVGVLEHALMDPDSGVRETAVEALADIGGDRSAQAVAVALNDNDASVRAEAVYALGEIGGTVAIRLLQQALLDEQGYIRDAAAEYLDELGSPAP